MEASAPRDTPDDSIALSDVLAPLWRGRLTILAITTLAVALGMTNALNSVKYRSDGFLQFSGAIPEQKEKDKKEAPPGINPADFKRYAAAFGTSNRFNGYIRQNKLENVGDVHGLRNTFASREGAALLLEPVYPFTKLDARDLMDPPKDSNNNIIGLRISYEAATPESAQISVGMLGRYVIDSIIYSVYSDQLRFKHAEIVARTNKLSNDIIFNNEKLERFHRKGIDLEKIVARYPESANVIGRQVVTVNEESARYLSPRSQMMTNEVEAGEAKEAIYAAKREQAQNILLREYYDRAKILLDTSTSGEAILRGLEPLKEATFKGKDLQNEAIKEVYNTISIDNQNALSLYLEKSRFIAGPSLPESRSTRLSTALVLSFFLGLLVSIIVVFGRAWWRNNRLKMAD